MNWNKFNADWGKIIAYRALFYQTQPLNVKHSSANIKHFNNKF
jgi:hypothetical protein